jgi:hypothetical protein
MNRRAVPLGLATVALLTACSTTKTATAKISRVAKTSDLAALPSCSPGDNPLRMLAPEKLVGPAHGTVTANRVRRSWSIDDGQLEVAPAPPTDKPALSARQAACNLIAAITPNGAPLSGLVPMGSTLGYGRLTVSPQVGHSPVYLGDPEQPIPTPPNYRYRPAWILTVRYLQAFSCPAMVGPLPSPRPTTGPPAWSYVVLAVDATTGADAVTYVGRAFAGCGGGRAIPASSTIPRESVSVPWRAEKTSSDGSTGQVEALYAGCESVDPQGAWVNRSRPELEVDAGLTLGRRCGPPAWHAVDVHPATVTQTIPARLEHATVGPIDWTDD